VELAQGAHLVAGQSWRRESFLNALTAVRWITQCVDRGADRLSPSNVDVDAGTHADHNRN